MPAAKSLSSNIVSKERRQRRSVLLAVTAFLAGILRAVTRGAPAASVGMVSSADTAWKSVEMCFCYGNRQFCQESQWNPGVHQEECGQQDEGGSPSPLHCPGEAPSAVLCPVLGSPVQER